MAWRRVVAAIPAIFILAIFAIACDRGQKTVDIELDAFSGRPNPKWTISGAPAGEIEKRIDGLSERAEAPELPGLGFRGYVVSAGGRTSRVFRGRVERAGEWFRDTAAIESELKRQAVEHGFGTIVEIR